MHLDDTIVAVSTPPGRGGIGVVRLSGPASLEIATPLLRLKYPLATGHATFGELVDTNTGDRIDEVVVTFFEKPHSYTTEDIVEISAHGSPVVLEYIDTMAGIFRAGGFSVSLTHHLMHVIGSRLMGFTQELFDDSRSRSLEPEQLAVMMREMAQRYPYVVEIAGAASHEGDSVVGPGCDDQFEFEFALDLLLDGFERLRQQK